MRVRKTRPQQLESHENRGQDIVQVVRNAGCERSNTFNPLGSQQLRLDLLLFGNVGSERELRRNSKEWHLMGCDFHIENGSILPSMLNVVRSLESLHSTGIGVPCSQRSPGIDDILDGHSEKLLEGIANTAQPQRH